MLKKRKLRKFFNKKWQSISHHLDTFCANHSPEALHQLRVEVKKIKGLMRLLKACSGKKHSGFSIMRLNKMYDQAGAIRTAQMNIQFINSRHVYSQALVDEQTGIIHRQSKAFCKHKKQYKKDIDKVRKKISKKILAIANKHIAAYYALQLNVLGFDFVTVDTHYLHDDRKIIKNLLYALPVLPATLSAQMHLNSSYLDQLQEVIGQWHDSEASLQLLHDSAINDAGIITPLKLQRGQHLMLVQSLGECFKEKAASE